MIGIILAAGYGTRLYPYTVNTPKCMIKYKNRYILEYLIEGLEDIPVEKIFIITNMKFYYQIKCAIKKNNNVVVVHDGTINNRERLGATKDLKLVLDRYKIDKEVIVLGSDNILKINYKKVKRFFEHNKKSCLVYYKENELSKLKATGVAVLNHNEVKHFREKPQEYISSNAVPPLYIFTKDVVNYIKRTQLCFDSPGQMIEHLVLKYQFVGYKIKSRIDAADIIRSKRY